MHFFISMLKMFLLLHLQHKLFLELRSTFGGDMGVAGVGSGGMAGGDVGGGIGGGGRMDGCDNKSKQETDTTLSPSNCGMNAITGGLLGSSRCHLCFAGGDRLIVTPAPPPTASAASFLDAARVQCTAAAAFVTADALGAAANGAAVAVAVEAETAA
jgi:hypothetical protein